LGILLKYLKHYDEAEAAYRKATAYSNLGIHLHVNLERYGEAESIKHIPKSYRVKTLGQCWLLSAGCITAKNLHKYDEEY
jgi:hypothetical protein